MQLDEVLAKKGISRLNPVQEEAITKGLLEGKSLVISAPTGSGKTLCAELAALGTVKTGKKTVIVSPLRALATEHAETFRELHESTALSIGDYDTDDPKLRDYDIISCSYEKFDSLLRHNIPWLREVGLLVVDEIHEIDSDRGPTLEVLIARIKHLLPNVQVLALSATIPNAYELATWLDAGLVESTYRAVPLHQGIMFGDTIDFGKQSEKVLSDKDDFVAMAEHALNKRQQAIIFAATKKQAEAMAFKLRTVVKKHAECRKLDELAAKAYDALERPTEQCAKLKDCLQHGVSFHHAGLVHKQRKLVEQAFKDGHIKIVVATPTLAAGINLPAHYVLIPSMNVYRNLSLQLMPVREYQQKIGRAGRIKYDTFGESIILAKTDKEKDHFAEKYIHGQAEPVYSHLGSEPVLRSHVLAALCSFAHTTGALESFFAKTFYAHQYGDTSALNALLKSVCRDLQDWAFIKIKDDKLTPTELGLRVSQLYVDPLSAYAMIRALRSKKHGNERAYTFMVCDTDEMRPWLSVSGKAENHVWENAYSHESQLFKGVTEWTMDDYHFLNKYRLTLMLIDWLHEKTEETLLKDYNIPPGILRGFLENADWLLYSAFELAKVLDEKERAKDLVVMRKRMRSGIHEELIPLTSLKHIGRVRARALWAKNIRSVDEVKKARLDQLVAALGPGIAKLVKEQLGETVDEKRLPGQKLLANY